MDRIERIATALRSLDLGSGVAIEGRTFVGPEDALARLRELEGIAEGLASRDLFALYDRRILHDGVFEEDIHASGRYYAYLDFELKGATPEERENLLATALEDLVTQYGKDAVLGRIPPRVQGRQVTEGLVVRPEVDDYPSYYSKTRMAYAEKMAADELPKAVLAPIRAEQERLLDSFGWTTVRVQDPTGQVVEVCGDAYVVSEAGLAAIGPYLRIWETLVDRGPEAFYDLAVATDGEYAPDPESEVGRYYAYVRATLKGQSSADRREALLAALPQEAVEALGAETVAALFREEVAGDQVTASLTIRPEAEEYPSYFNAKKIEAGERRAMKQILINVQAEIIAAVERALGSATKYIILG
ncbi:MAG TPA: hypothetical protein VFL04_04670 [Rectinemataceae bacterium]|nr:hypothetical protein [Rectinemataceae bacterium]